MMLSAQSIVEVIQSVETNSAVSDLNFKEGEPAWHRIVGKLKRIPNAPVIDMSHLSAFLNQLEPQLGLTAQKIEDLLAKKGDVDLVITLGGRRYRGSIFRTDNKKIEIVLRKLEDTIRPLHSLNLPDHWVQLLSRTKGLLIVTGATGSGKSTTLASSIEYLNETREGHIITLEDPIEVLFKNKKCLIDQRQIGPDAKDFSSGLRASLRQDPDIILIGELRDFETVKIALDAANTGHLVLATLHTMNAKQSIERITSFFPAESREWAQQLLSQVLLGVLSQVLIPHISKPERVLVSELMVNTRQVMSAIREGNTNQIANAMDTGSKDGHVLMNKSFSLYVKQKIIHAEDAIQASYDPSQLLKELTNAI